MGKGEVRATAYRVAKERKDRGLNSWSKQIKIRHITTRDQSSVDPAVIAQKGSDIAKVLRLSLGSTVLNYESDDYDMNLEGVIDELADIDLSEAVDHYNCIMSRLYDWADINRVLFT